MAFWGVEVKPGKPYVHHYNGDQGRLHLSQATLGTGSSTKKTILQCNVGDKQPIYLCSLLPEKLETCPLNHEFEEDEEVTFSVIGPHTIHLSGFFFGENEDGGESDDFEGQMIESDSESDDYIDYDMEDEDEDGSFDDADDLDMYPSSPARRSGVKIEEIVDDGNPSNENGVSKQTKKKKSKTSKSSDNEDSEKQIVVKNGIGISVLESEDEDGFPISSPGDEQDKGKDKNDLQHAKSLKRKIAAVDQDGENSRRGGQPDDPSVQTNITSPVNETKQKKKNKKKEASDKGEITNETDSKSDISKGVNCGDLGQNAEREKEKEKKKKKKKKKENGTNTEQSTIGKNGPSTEMKEKAEAKPFQMRSFPNGLVIEELAMGKPDGKKAAPGKKVSVRYIGKLKKNGKIFDSNIGRAPFKFRLGIGEVIKGWDVGVNGMRVGDKRRLTIPPAMGYGSGGAGAAIPPNSSLVFDVELVDVN